jgi:xylulokinase
MIIAHDLGTTGNKASLHDESGRLLQAVTVTYPTRYAAGGVAEQDPDQWWHAVREATHRLVAGGRARPEQVTAIGMSGQMMGAVFLDGGLRPLGPALIWADNRARQQAKRLAGRLDAERAYRILGHRIDPTYSLEKVMWVRENEPERYARTRHVCLAKDYVTWHLTGRLLTDRSDASGTNAYDQHAGGWSGEVLDAAEVDRRLLPEIVESTTVAGTLTKEAAADLGLPGTVQVVVGGGDGPTAAVGAGVVQPGAGAYAYCGSSSWISLASEAPLHDSQQRTMTFNHVVPGLFAPTATMVAGGASLEWWSDIVEGRRGSGRVSAALEAADKVSASADGLYFLPHLLGERSPYWNPEASGAFVGLGRQHTRPHLVRAVLEGVALNMRTNLMAFLEAGAQVPYVDAIGGGAASDVWLQLMADIWERPVRRRSIVEEANSLGAAVTTAVAIGAAPDFGVATGLSEVTAEFIPRGDVDWVERHEIFLAAYRALEPWSAGRFGATGGRS